MRFELCCYRITPVTEIVTLCSSDSEFNVIANGVEFLNTSGIVMLAATHFSGFFFHSNYVLSTDSASGKLSA
jgi:hypothetical protein